MAAPAKYTEETIGRLEQALAMGAKFHLACKYAGITEETLSQWRKRKPGFTERLQKAQGSAAVKWLAVIEKAAQSGTWQAAAWKLERLYPQDYGRTIQEHQGRDGGAIQLETTDARDRLLFEVEERRARIQEVPRLPVPDDGEREEGVA